MRRLAFLALLSVFPASPAFASWGPSCVPAVVGQTKFTGDQPATVIFALHPSNGILQINDYVVKATGSSRKCVTDPIGPGDSKLLDVLLKWPDLGKEACFELLVEGGKTYNVDVTAGHDKLVTCTINGKLLQYVAQAPLVEHNFGIDMLKLNGSKERYSINGQPVNREAAIEAARGGGIPNDAGLPFLTLIGPKDDRSQAEADLAGPLRSLRDAFRVQAYDPSDAMLKDRDGKPMFKTDGKPTIYFQRADGKVLGRFDEYPGTAGMEFAMREALRKADPKYDPTKDPVLKPATPPSPAPSPLPEPVPFVWPKIGAELVFGALCLCGLAVLLFLGLRRR